MGSWSKAWNKTECLSIPLNRKRRLFYSWAVVLPKFSGKSCLMMRVKTLSKDKFVSLEVYRKEKKVLPLPVVARRSKTLLLPYFRPTKEKVPCLHKVCVRASWQNTCSVVFLFLLLLFSFGLNLFWGPSHSLGKGNKTSTREIFLPKTADK